MKQITDCTSEVTPKKECGERLELVQVKEGHGRVPLCPRCDKQTLAFMLGQK